MIESYKRFVAVRRSGEKEWPDLSTVSNFPLGSKLKACQRDAEEGVLWTRDNPVTRYALIEIREIDKEQQ